MPGGPIPRVVGDHMESEAAMDAAAACYVHACRDQWEAAPAALAVLRRVANTVNLSCHLQAVLRGQAELDPGTVAAALADSADVSGHVWEGDQKRVLLSQLCYCGHHEEVPRLVAAMLESGAGVAARDSNDLTPLHHAAYCAVDPGVCGWGCGFRCAEELWRRGCTGAESERSGLSVLSPAAVVALSLSDLKRADGSTSRLAFLPRGDPAADGGGGRPAGRLAQAPVPARHGGQPGQLCGARRHPRRPPCAGNRGGDAAAARRGPGADGAAADAGPGAALHLHPPLRGRWAGALGCRSTGCQPGAGPPRALGVPSLGGWHGSLLFSND